MESVGAEVFASVLIVTRDRPREITECLESIVNAARPFPIEILLILNGEDQSAPAFDPKFAPGLSFRVLRCSNRTPAAARNHGLPFASGEYVCFLDDDVKVPGDYFETAAVIFRSNSGILVLGGPDRTFEGAGLLERAIGVALTSPLATGRTSPRHGGGSPSTVQAASEAVLILCNLWVKREVFYKKKLQFDETFRRGEENVLLNGLGREGCLFTSRLFVYHRRKSDLRRFVRAVFQSGWFRAKSFIQYPGTLAPEYALPTIFLTYLLGLATGVLSSLPLFAYLLVSSSAALYLGLRARAVLLSPWIFFYQALIPTAYGAGFAGGLVFTFLSCAPAWIFQGRKKRKIPNGRTL